MNVHCYVSWSPLRFISFALFGSKVHSSPSLHINKNRINYFVHYFFFRAHPLSCKRSKKALNCLKVASTVSSIWSPSDKIS